MALERDACDDRCFHSSVKRSGITVVACDHMHRLYNLYSSFSSEKVTQLARSRTWKMRCWPIIDCETTGPAGGVAGRPVSKGTPEDGGDDSRVEGGLWPLTSLKKRDEIAHVGDIFLAGCSVLSCVIVVFAGGLSI